MKVSMFLSVTGMSANADYIGRQLAMACVSVKLAANVMPYYSSLDVKGRHKIEAGSRIDLLSVAQNRLDDILYLWKRLLDLFDCGCLHMEISQGGLVYDGCICAWPYYRHSYPLIHPSGPITCADDAMHRKSDNDLLLSVLEKHVPKVRYGKPLC